MRLDEKLVSLRKEKNLTQSKVAEKLDVSRQAISRWEAGIAMPSTENLRGLSQLYSVSLEYLLDDGMDNPSEMAETKVPPAEKEEVRKRVPKWKRVVLAAVLISIAVVFSSVFVYSWIHRGQAEIRMGEIPGEEVDVKPAKKFDIEW